MYTKFQNSNEVILMSKIYSLGIDVGSTTVKTVILDGDDIIYNKYERHFSKVRETVGEQLRIIKGSISCR